MPQEQIEKIFESFSSPKGPGFSAGVLQNGEFIYKGVGGLANIELNVPMTSQSVFNIGSMSKQFTAFAVALLEAEGKLSLDDDIRSHLPNMPDLGHVLTIRNLIHHTSGVRDSFPELLALAGWRDTDATTTTDVLRLLESQQATNFTPGDEFVYCNSNYVLLAEIVSKVSGSTFAEFCRTMIFEPLGMTNTVINDNFYVTIKKRVSSYYEDNGAWYFAPVTDSVVGPTNVYTSLEDFAKWVDNFRTHRIGGDDLHKRILEPGSLNNGRELDYAFGLEIGQAHTHKGWGLVEHGGSQAGYSSWMIHIPDRKITSVVFFNAFMWNTREYCIRLLDLFLEDNPDAPTSSSDALERKPIHLTTEQMKPCTGVYYHPVRGWIRKISFPSDTLMYRGNPLAPISEDKYYLTGKPEIEIHFTPETMSVITKAETIIYQKTTPFDLSSVDLSIYNGKYFSEEVGHTWTITAQKDTLKVTRWKYPPTRMTPLFQDAFNDDWLPVMGYPTNYTILFDREDKGVIIGFKLSGNGVRHINFCKV
ncbi:serine hydrolase domain-containing protein [Chloroflexota bacterium]